MIEAEYRQHRPGWRTGWAATVGLASSIACTSLSTQHLRSVARMGVHRHDVTERADSVSGGRPDSGLREDRLRTPKEAESLGGRSRTSCDGTGKWFWPGSHHAAV